MTIIQDLIREMDLWKPQIEALEVFDRLMTVSKLGKDITKQEVISNLIREPSITHLAQKKLFDFTEEINPKTGTEFPSFCFAIATGGGKTRLMGACIAYLYNTKGFKNFFILSKGETIYTKHRKEDFDPAADKYVFKGLDGFPVPRLIDGDNYERSSYPELFSDDLTIYLFNIEKIFNERTDVEFRFHKFQESIGGSFADILRKKKDLVFLMDESHRVRAEKSLKAINALKPILGLEFTATPIANNVIYAYSLRDAIVDGLVKRPVVITRRDDDSLVEEKEEIKLKDGIRRHEQKKALLETYCHNNKLPLVKPRVLICAPPSAKGQEQKHIERIAEYLQSDKFLNGKYKGRVLPVHQGSDDQQIQQLLQLEKGDNDIEIVIHVNKLKEGWDVKTIYTIIPLRASVSEILTLQTIGRGLRLPFGKPVSRAEGLTEAERKELFDIDTLEIISHEKYSAVLAKVNEVLDVIGVKTDEGEQLASYEIAPDGNKKYALNIPLIEAIPHSEEDIDFSGITPEFEGLQDLEVKLVGKDIASWQDLTYDKITEECQGSLVNFFVRILIEGTDEFDIRDKPKLQKFVKAYLDKVKISGDKKDEILFKHRGKIANDILTKITQKTRDNTTIEYEVTDKIVEFQTYWRNFPKGYIEKQKDAVLETELIHNIIKGYQKTIFTKNIFDSKQEKWLADILDHDKEVIRWVRPATGQMPIEYKEGNYNPDFVVEGKDGHFYILEVKARDKLNTDEVKTKAQSALDWCQAMSQATRKKWEYKLIPHDAISATQSFAGVISHAVTI
jgi:restriction endonuclease